VRELEVADGGAVLVAALCLPQVHAYVYTCAYTLRVSAVSSRDDQGKRRQRPPEMPTSSGSPV